MIIIIYYLNKLNNIEYYSINDSNTMLRKAYSKIWVPVMGRILSLFTILIEGKQPDKLPTYDIDKDLNKDEDRN